MATNEKVIINKFINVLWRWIRGNEIPAQTDAEGWNAFIHSGHRILDEFEAEHFISNELHWLFIKWVNDYLEYAGKESKKYGEDFKTD